MTDTDPAIPPGYKMTEVGVIPEDWEVVTLKDIGTFKKGRNIPKQSLTSYGLPCVLYGEVYTKYTEVATQLESRISAETARDSASIQYGDILFAGSGETSEEIGKCFAYIGKENAYAGGDLIILSPENSDSVFLGYLLNSAPVQRQKAILGQGSSVVHIYISGLSKVFIPIPPTLDEQRAIADALSEVDAQITALDDLIAKKRKLKQGAMQSLLTGAERLPGFSGEWEVKRLGEVFEITSSKRVYQSEWKTEGIPFYRARELAVLGEKGIIENDLFISREMYCAYKTAYGVPQIGDILVTGVGTLGKVYVVSDNREFYFKDGNIIWFKISNKINSHFLRQLYLSPIISKQIEDHSAGTTVGTYTISAAKRTVVPFPPPDEQTAIAAVLSDMDAEISALEAKREKTAALKQGMMQELLTGKTRLI